jgi:hypothetical protein
MSTTPLTAADAATLARSKSPEGAVDVILAEVRKQAEAGKTSLKTYSCGFGAGGLYTDESKFPELQREVLKRLRALGYVAGVRVEERQFVDLWLHVSWEGAK